MSKKKSKYYVVWKGRTLGVLDNWEACKASVFGYEDAKYKSFESKAEAEYAYANGVTLSVGKKNTSLTSGTRLINNKSIVESKIIYQSMCVDAACSGNPGIMEYRGVQTDTGKEIFRKTPFQDGTNNIGEFLALVHGIAYLQKQGFPDLPIYSDSQIALGWIKLGKAKTKLELTTHNKILFELIHRAEEWLANNKFKNPLLKWETKIWGEIPADFGRK